MRPTSLAIVPRLLLLLAAAVLFTAACGDDDDDAESTGVFTETPNPFPSQAPPLEQPTPAQDLDANPAEPADGVIEVTLADIRFSPNNLHVPLDSAVTIRLTNEDAVGHTMRVANIDGMYETEDDAVIESISPGSSEELTFSGAAAGTYTFRCDIHPDTMGGVIVVE